jgi:hypothetical protein
VFVRRRWSKLQVSYLKPTQDLGGIRSQLSFIRPSSREYVEALRCRLETLENLVKAHRLDGDDLSEAHSGVCDQTIQLNSKQVSFNAASPSDPSSPPASSPNTGGRGFSHLCFDATTGELRRYGPTSYFRFVGAVDSEPHPGGPDDTGSGTPSTASPVESSSSTFQSISTDTHPGLRPPASIMTELRPDQHARLLNTFFTWINPWCLWVSRAEFMASLSPSDWPAGNAAAPPPRSSTYSEMLHLTMLAVASPLVDDLALRSDCSDPYTSGVPFAAQAKRLIEVESAKPMLSTVQALMLLGSVVTNHRQY